MSPLSRARRVALAAALAVLVVPLAARAHETLHEVEKGKAVAVKAYFADGEVMAYTPTEVFSPADAKIPWQKGRTDRAGWVAFHPDVPGAWRVRVTDDTGHGLDLTVDVSDAPSAGPAAADQGGSDASLGTAAFVLRPLVGVAAIVALFAGVYLFHRRRKTP